MHNRLRIQLTVFAVSLAACLPGLALAQAASTPTATPTPMAHNASEMTFAAVKGLPECTSMAPQSGDPMKGAFILAVKASAGCVIPWHWHSANEHLIIASGTATIETKGEKPATLQSGAFVSLPSRHVHQLHADTDCLVYVESDAAFDIHYVNEKGDEIPPEVALAAGHKSGDAMGTH